MKKFGLAIFYTVFTCSGNASAIKPITAVEVFHLRSECAALAKKILQDNLESVPRYDAIGGDVVSQTGNYMVSQDQVSHYDPQTNRCYVVLTNSYSNKDGHVATILFDGQTGEKLAIAEIKSIKNGKLHTWGMMYDPQHQSPLDPSDASEGYNDVKAYIDMKMADDRKQ